MTWQPRRGSPTERVEGVEELAQALSILLETPLGSVPHQPELGSELWRLLDQPLDVVRALAPAEVLRAVSRDPRLQVLETLVVSGSDPGTFELDVRWRPAGSLENGDVTRVSLTP